MIRSINKWNLILKILGGTDVPTVPHGSEFHGTGNGDVTVLFVKFARFRYILSGSGEFEKTQGCGTDGPGVIGPGVDGPGAVVLRPA